MAAADPRSRLPLAADLVLDVTLAPSPPGAWTPATRVGPVLAVHAGGLDVLDAAPLHPAERAYLETLAVPRRRHSYLLGRLAGRMALARLVDAESLAQISIGRGAFGQPVLEHGGPGLAVSITHSDDIGAAVAYPAGFPMGIDVEAAAPDRVGTMHTQFTASERRFVDGVPPAMTCEVTTAIWGAKEALSKVLACGMTCPFEVLGVKDVCIGPDGVGGHFENFYQYQFVSRHALGHVLTLVLPRTARLSLRTRQVEDMLR